MLKGCAMKTTTVVQRRRTTRRALLLRLVMLPRQLFREDSRVTQCHRHKRKNIRFGFFDYVECSSIR